MKRAYQLFLLILSVLLLLSACAPKNESAGPAMWKVTSKDGNVLYLFGSIHAATDDIYPLRDSVMKAYDSCDALAVELDTNNMDGDTLKSMYTAMLLTDGTTIADHCDAATFEAMTTVLQEEGIYSPLYNAFGPVFWQTILEGAALKKAGLDSEKGIDSHFLSLAHESGKEILEVESLEFQIGLLVSDEAQKDAAALLPLLAERFEDCAKYYAYLYESYARGDMETISYLVNGNAQNPVNTGDASLDDLIRVMGESESEWDSAYSTAARNRNMAQAAAEYLASGKKVFFVVGAAHMVGPDGIPALLEEMGYTVERT